MRKVRGVIGTLGLGLLLAAIPALADHHEGSQLIESEKGAWEAWKNGNAEYFETHVADDSVMILGDGHVLSKAEIVGQIGSCEVAGYELSNFRTHSLGAEVRILTYEAEQEAVCEGVKVPSSLTVSSTWALRDGKWLNVHYQETVRMESE